MQLNIIKTKLLYDDLKGLLENIYEVNNWESYKELIIHLKQQTGLIWVLILVALEEQ